jgi:hypothetical protein
MSTPVGFRSGGNEELFEAGDAYFVGPGHTPILYAGTSWAQDTYKHSNGARSRLGFFCGLVVL